MNRCILRDYWKKRGTSQQEYEFGQLPSNSNVLSEERMQKTLSILDHFRESTVVAEMGY